MSDFVPHAVMQTTLDAPDVERLRAALVTVRGFTAADAAILANDAFGILVKNVDAETAAALQGALRGHGIETEITAMSMLPPTPPGKVVRRLECHSDTLVIYDPIGRPVPIEWKHVMLIAAGNVRVQEFRTITRMVRAPYSGDERNGQPILEPERHTREETNERPLLEIILARGVQRFSVEVDKVLFACLGERKTPQVWDNLGLVVRDLLAHAPHSLTNSGAHYICAEPPACFDYPSKNAFFEEIMWMMWKAEKQPGH